MAPDQDLRDRLDIIDVCTKMHWNVDQKDWDAMDTVLADQVSMPTLAEQGSEGFDPANYLRSREQIKAGYPLLIGDLVTQHLIAGHQVDLDGDRAVCRAQAISTHVAESPTGQSVVTHGMVYRFDLVRTDDGWRICGRQTWMRWSNGDDSIHDVAAKQVEWAKQVQAAG